MIVLGLYFILLFIYITGLLKLNGKWIEIKDTKLVEIFDEKSFSIIVAFRNEKENIPILIRSLNCINYNDEKFEIIFVNDDSEDNGKEVLAELIKNKINYKLIDNSFGEGKKGALSSGIEFSKKDYIITIDADCVVPENLLKLYSQKLCEEDYDFISGPVQYEGSNLTSSILNFELSGLVLIGASSIENKTPNMANGANLCFKKMSYEKVNGYKKNKDFASGDDEFLLHSISKLKDSKIGFLKSQDAIVTTRKPGTFKEYINQRLRWSSKWRYYKTTSQKIAPIFIFSLYLIQLINYSQTEYKLLFLSLLGIKVVFEIIFMSKITKFYKQKYLLRNVILTQIYYPFYVVIIAIISVVKVNYIWKERIVK